ncbi:MAG TPA: SAM-dependent methyltransferase [Actinomycetota bacterium]|nr:SAM-dependent methyltransferase [Actinomycetota bacterium]
MTPNRAGPGAPPSAWVQRWTDLVPEGSPVLDVACGAGRHTRWFLAHGHPVTAIDRDLGGLGDLTGSGGLEIVEADLEAGAPFPPALLQGRRFGGVVVTNYLHRPLLGDLVAVVDHNGVLLYETFSERHPALGGRPSNPDFLLRTGELLEVVRGRLDVVAYEDVIDGPSAVQRIAAIRTS